MTKINTSQTLLAIETPNPADLAVEGKAALADAEMILIADDAGLKEANDVLKAMNGRLKELEEVRKNITRPLDAAKKNIMALFKPVCDAYTEAIKTTKGSIAVYVNEQNRKAAEARAKAEAEAAETRKAIEAKAAVAESVEEKAAIMETAALVQAAPAVAEPAVKVITRKAWHGRVTDKAALIAHIAANPNLLELVEIKQGALDRLVAATGGACDLPGVKPYADTVVVSR
jgi:hypothetical protein